LPKRSEPFERLTAILDAESAARAGWPILELAAAYLAGGARLLQLRAKSASGAWLFDTASALAELARPAAAAVIVNDRADIARLAGAAGVHVGQDDLPPAAARGIGGPDAIVGVSTHTPAQLAGAVDEPIDYVAIGPVFRTHTKATGYEPIGLDGVKSAAAAAATHRRPLVAIGGITLENAADVIRAGAASVAVIGDLVAGGQPERRVRAYVSRLSHV
jgi:thiamine-phosphate pyrophosphorylase